MADYNINGTLVCSSPFYSDGMQSIARESTSTNRIRLYVLPELGYADLNSILSTSLTSSSTISEYLTVWLRYVVTYYETEVKTGYTLWPLFIGVGKLGAAFTIIFQSYGQSNAISNNMPRYGYGIIMRYGDPLIRFKVSEYTLTLYKLTETTL